MIRALCLIFMISPSFASKAEFDYLRANSFKLEQIKKDKKSRKIDLNQVKEIVDIESRYFKNERFSDRVNLKAAATERSNSSKKRQRKTH